jgi:peptide/nickel transport system substrate-binding protein
MTPLFNPMLSGRGKAGFFGWPDDPQLEKLRADFVTAKTPEEQKKAASAIQAHAMEVVNYVPLGEYKIASVWRKETKGYLESPVPVFWNIEKK